MAEISITVNKIRNINHADFSMPLNKGLYAIVGPNGCGKSTIMLIMSLIVKTSSAHMLAADDLQEQSTIDIRTDDGYDHWFFKNGKMTTGKYTHVRAGGKIKYPHSALVVSTHWPGFYEGSIFYGCRFDDFDSIGNFLSTGSINDELTPADSFVSETLGYILHNDKSYYSSLLKIKNRKTAEKYGFKGMPYFIEYNGHIVSQFKMSSGECLLISLIDFINNLVIKGGRSSKFLFLIDEVELALHPGAIDRLVIFLENLINSTSSELVIYFSTHSAELIQRIHARNIFLIENEAGNIEVTNPCYPNYAIRNLYVPKVDCKSNFRFARFTSGYGKVLQD